MSALCPRYLSRGSSILLTIRNISARHLKARISIKTNFVMFFVVNHNIAPTEEASEGQKAKNIAALNSTVASVPAREYVFVL